MLDKRSSRIASTSKRDLRESISAKVLSTYLYVRGIKTSGRSLVQGGEDVIPHSSKTRRVDLEFVHSHSMHLKMRVNFALLK